MEPPVVVTLTRSPGNSPRLLVQTKGINSVGLDPGEECVVKFDDRRRLRVTWDERDHVDG